MRRSSEPHTFDERLNAEKARIEAALESIRPGPERDLLDRHSEACVGRRARSRQASRGSAERACAMTSEELLEKAANPLREARRFPREPCAPVRSTQGRKAS